MSEFFKREKKEIDDQTVPEDSENTSASYYSTSNGASSDSQFDPERARALWEDGMRQREIRDAEEKAARENSPEVIESREKVIACYEENEDEQEMSM